MVQRRLKNEDGYTIVELLVALTIVSILLGIAGSTFVFISRQMNRWSSNMEFYNNYHLVETKLYNDILRSESFVLSDSSFVLTNSSKEENTYTWKEGVFALNEQDLSFNSVDSLAFQMTASEEENNIIIWNLIQKKDEHVFGTDFILHGRNPSLWKPMRTNKKGGL